MLLTVALVTVCRVGLDCIKCRITRHSVQITNKLKVGIFSGKYFDVRIPFLYYFSKKKKKKNRISSRFFCMCLMALLKYRISIGPQKKCVLCAKKKTDFNVVDSKKVSGNQYKMCGLPLIGLLTANERFYFIELDQIRTNENIYE